MLKNIFKPLINLITKLINLKIHSFYHYHCKHHHLPTSTKPLINLITKLINLKILFFYHYHCKHHHLPTASLNLILNGIYRKVFNIFIIIYIATSKDKKKHVKNRYYGRRGFVFLCYHIKVFQVAAFIVYVFELYILRSNQHILSL